MCCAVSLPSSATCKFYSFQKSTKSYCLKQLVNFVLPVQHNWFLKSSNEEHGNAAACKFTFVLLEHPLHGSYTSMHLLFKMSRLNALGLTVVLVVRYAPSVDWRPFVRAWWGYYTLACLGHKRQRFSCFSQCMLFRFVLFQVAPHSQKWQTVCKPKELTPFWKKYI